MCVEVSESRECVESRLAARGDGFGRHELLDAVGTLLTLNLLTTTIVAPSSNASKWQMGFNSAFKGLKGCEKFLEF